MSECDTQLCVCVYRVDCVSLCLAGFSRHAHFISVLISLQRKRFRYFSSSDFRIVKEFKTYLNLFVVVVVVIAAGDLGS